MRPILVSVLSVLGLLALMSPAQAGRYADWENWTSSGNAVLPSGSSDSPFRSVLAGGVGIAPEYLGGEDLETKPLPLFETTYAGKLFFSTQQGVGYNLWRKRTFRAGPRLTFDLGRDSADSPILAGLPDIDLGIEAGAFLEKYSGSWRIRADVRQEIAGGHGGLLGSFEVAWGSRWTKNTSIVLGVRTTLMDESYAESYFGVAPADANAMRSAYSPGAGLRDGSAFVQVIYDFTKNIFISMEGRGRFLLGDAAESPLTQSETAFTGAILAGVRF